MSNHAAALPKWTWLIPLLGWLILLLALSGLAPSALLPVVALLLAGTVFAAVHHAEVVAHRVGEPFGTLVLALAVTVIELALIISMMLSGEAGKEALARDTMYAAVMLICNGIVGLCLLVGGLRHGEQNFQLQGASAALAVLTTMVMLTLVLPNYAEALPGPALSSKQLAFTGVVSLVLYGAFIFVQTVRHRHYFLAPGTDENEQAPPPSNKVAWLSAGLLLVCLVAVVGLAKVLSPTIERLVITAGAPQAVVGIVIAALVLLPESLAAVRAARANRLQTSLNLALGSGLASIGLTIPAVALIFVLTGRPLVLGVEAKEMVLLALTLLISTITLATGRTTLLQGVVHLVLFATFLFFAIFP